MRTKTKVLAAAAAALVVAGAAASARGLLGWGSVQASGFGVDVDIYAA